MFHTSYVSYLIYHNLEFLQSNSELSTPLKQDRLFSSFLMHTNFQDSQLVKVNARERGTNDNSA